MHPWILLAVGLGLGWAWWKRAQDGPAGDGPAEAGTANDGAASMGKTWTFQDWPPPGLPVDKAPRPSARYAALDEVRAATAAEGLGPKFTAAMEALAMYESGARYNMPAWTYDNRPKAERPPGKGRVSAWGVFQWQDAHAERYFSLDHAWQMNHAQQTAGAVMVYADKLRSAGTSDVRWVFLWHVSPGAYYPSLKAGRLEMSDRVATAVDKYLSAAKDRPVWA